VNPAAPVPNGIAAQSGPDAVFTPRPELIPELHPEAVAPEDPAVCSEGPDASGGSEGSDRANRSGERGDRPWADSQFWILQFAVLALYLVRLASTVAFHLDTSSVELEFSTFVLFVVPAVYAALRYGMRGAVLTSAWITVLAVPRVIVAVGGRQFGAAWAEITQLLVLDALSLLIGQRVSGQQQARRITESTRAAHRSAEALYRDLFDSNQAPILIVDGTGSVVEANASAQRVFRRTDATPGIDRRSPPRDVETVRLVDMIGPDAAAQILSRLLDSQVGRPGLADDAITDDARIEPVAYEVDGQPVFFRPTGTMLNRSAGETRMQVVFEDVTAETRRHDLMEAYASRVVLGQEEERRHLAQELHDGPVQTLIHLCRQIDAVEKDTELTTGGSRVLADLRIIAEGTVAELRSIARGLRPSILDDLGLVASINQILSDAGDRQQFETSFGVTGRERRLPAPVELALFRIAQEAITNVERHASARHVAVGLSFESSGLRLLVKDDGVGFLVADHPQGDGGQSLGLPGMTERAHLIGSRLVLHSAPGSGTTIDVWVPATIIDPESPSHDG
jgi:signal transduction histidine kinase